MTTDKRCPERVMYRPDPNQWMDDELLNLREAIALFQPNGPLTHNALRNEIRDGRLNPLVIAGKLFITVEQMRWLIRPRLCSTDNGAYVYSSAPSPPKSVLPWTPIQPHLSMLERAKLARAATIEMLAELSVTSGKKAKPPQLDPAPNTKRDKGARKAKALKGRAGRKRTAKEKRLAKADHRPEAQM